MEKQLDIRSICVIGNGYVGTTTAAIFANSGFKVIALEINKKIVDTINNGKAPFYEVGLNELIKNARINNNLVSTTSYKNALKNTDIIFSCVGTPDKSDGSPDLKFVHSAAKEATKYMNSDAIYIQKSTVPVGTGKILIDNYFKKKNIKYISNPEFLREGSAVTDTLLFDRIVAGGDSKAAQIVLDLYKTIELKRKEVDFIAKLNTDPLLLENHMGEYIITSLESAELIKVSSNAFLALKISFANSIAKLADKSGADIKEVMSAVGADRRIGKSFLNAGRGYGGGCFPKDVSGLISKSKELGVDIGIMEASAKVNESMPEYIIDKIIHKTGSLKSKSVAVLGLAFKSGTSDIRRSPSIKIANMLIQQGAKVSTYDPRANEEAKKELYKDVLLQETLQKAVQNADIVMVCTDWPEFTEIDFSDLKKKMKGNVFVDCMNSFSTLKARQAGLIYLGVGRGDY